MKRGIKGGLRAGCCNKFEIWGLSCNAPNLKAVYWNDRSDNAYYPDFYFRKPNLRLFCPM
jgi:hypothetical protein